MVPISPEIYSSTAVVMDNRGLSDYILRLEDRRARRAAAEQDAIDRYINEASRKLTPTGMRTQDIPKFQQMESEWRNQALQYKNTKDPYKRLELDQKANELFLYIQRSKEEGEKGKQTRDYLKNPDAKNKLNLPRLMQDLTLHDLPLDFEGVPALGIPKRKSIDPNATYYRETPFDFKKTFDEAAKGPGITVSELSVKPSENKGFNVIEKGFSIPTTVNIISNFAKEVEADEDKKAYYTVRGRSLPAERLAELNKELKIYFPKMEVDDDDPISIAMAEAAEEATRRRTSDLQPIPKGTTVNIGKDGGGQTVRKLYDDVKKLSDAAAKKDKGAAVSEIPSSDAQIRIVQIAQKVMKDESLSNKDIFLKTGPDGKMRIYKVTKRDAQGGAIEGEPKAIVTREDLDLGFQPGAPEERQVIAEEKNKPKTPYKSSVKTPQLIGVPEGGF